MRTLKDLDYGDNWVNFVHQLRQLREEQGYTQEQLDHELGVTKGVVQKWERGRRRPSSYLLSCWVTKLNGELHVKKKIEAA